MLFKLFSQESFSCNTGHFVHPSVSLAKGDCPLHIVKHIFTLCNNFSDESVLKQGIKTAHVLIGEKKNPINVAFPHFLQVVYYDVYKRVRNTFCRCDGRCSSLHKQCIFHMYLQKKSDSFLKFLRKSWGLFVT